MSLRLTSPWVRMLSSERLINRANLTPRRTLLAMNESMFSQLGPRYMRIKLFSFSLCPSGTLQKKKKKKLHKKLLHFETIFYSILTCLALHNTFFVLLAKCTLFIYPLPLSQHTVQVYQERSLRGYLWGGGCSEEWQEVHSQKVAQNRCILFFGFGCSIIMF